MGGGRCVALSNGNAFPGLVTPSVTGTVVRAFPERAICCSSRIPKTNPGEGGDAGVQKQAISDGGSYPDALIT
jgi:hypothetical protein